MFIVLVLSLFLIVFPYYRLIWIFHRFREHLERILEPFWLQWHGKGGWGDGMGIPPKGSEKMNQVVEKLNQVVPRRFE